MSLKSGNGRKRSWPQGTKSQIPYVSKTKYSRTRSVPAPCSAQNSMSTPSSPMRLIFFSLDDKRRIATRRKPAVVLLLLPLHDHNKTHDAKHRRLHPRVFCQHDGHVADERHVADDAAHNVLPLEVVLCARIQVGVVGRVVVAFCEELCARSVPRRANTLALHRGQAHSHPSPKRTLCRTCERCGGQSECPSRQCCTPPPRQRRTPGGGCGSRGRAGRRAGMLAPWSPRGRRQSATTSQSQRTCLSRSSSHKRWARQLGAHSTSRRIP